MSKYLFIIRHCLIMAAAVAVTLAIAAPTQAHPVNSTSDAQAGGASTCITDPSVSRIAFLADLGILRAVCDEVASGSGEGNIGIVRPDRGPDSQLSCVGGSPYLCCTTHAGGLGTFVHVGCSDDSGTTR